MVKRVIRLSYELLRLVTVITIMCVEVKNICVHYKVAISV